MRFARAFLLKLQCNRLINNPKIILAWMLLVNKFHINIKNDEVVFIAAPIIAHCLLNLSSRRFSQGKIAYPLAE